jgi:hypothetical protein
MPARRKTGLDFAEAALTRHLQAMAMRQGSSDTGELSATDLALIVRATDALLGLEQVRVNLVLKAFGRRIETMPTKELERFFDRMENREDLDEETNGN